MKWTYPVLVLFLAFLFVSPSPTQAIGDVITRDNANALSLFDTITTDEAVYSVAWSPDNNALVYGLADGTVLQETLLPARASMPALLGGHTDAVTSVDVSFDGVWAFSASMDGTLRAWERSTGIMQPAPGLSTTIVGEPFLLSVSAHPDSPNVIAYSGEDSPIYQRVWDAPVTGPPTLIGHTNFVFDVEYSPDGTLLATGGADASVRVWDYLSGVQQSSDTLHLERVYDVAFSRAGDWLVATGQDRLITVRPVLSPGEPFIVAEVPDSTGDTVVNTIDVGLEGDIVAVGDSNGVLRIYSVPSPTDIVGRLLFEVDTGDDQIRDLAISPDGTMIAIAGFDRTLEIWNIPTPTLGTPPTLPTTSAPITGDYCTGAPSSRLAIGMRARVTYTDGTPLRLRSAPGEAIIAEMAEGTEFNIIGGPLCVDSFTWWQLELDDGTVGWSAEGDTSDYYIEPLTSTTPTTDATISGTIWHDICDNSGATVDFCTLLADGSYVADGVRAGIEPVIPNVTVQLGEGACPIATSIMETITTPDGRYQFSGLSAGTYCLFVNPSYGGNSVALIPGEWTYPLFLDPLTGIAYQSITVADGATVTDVEFGWDYQFAP